MMPRQEPALPKCLITSLGLRVPVFEHGTTPRVKADQLETYLLLSAYTQGELTEERFGWMRRLVPLEDRWAHLTGWEALKRTRTEKGVTDAKRQVAPDLYDQIEDHNWMIQRLTEEIDRMERDATKSSRAFTMLTGT